MVITNNDLRQKLAEVQQLSRYTNKTTQTTKEAALKEEGTVFLTVEKVIKIKGNRIITDRNTTATLYNSTPGLYWKATGTPDKNGYITLKKPFNALIIADGTNNYVLGVDGATNEIEIRFHVGDNEIRLNNDFININGKHIIVNGLEVQQ